MSGVATQKKNYSKQYTHLPFQMFDFRIKPGFFFRLICLCVLRRYAVILGSSSADRLNLNPVHCLPMYSFDHSKYSCKNLVFEMILQTPPCLPKLLSHNGGNAIGSLRLGKYTTVSF